MSIADRATTSGLLMYEVQPGFAARTWGVFRLACLAGYEDNCFGIAKGAAYSALLSLFPVLTTVTALLVQANADAVARVLSRIVFEVAPPGTQDLLQNYLSLHGKRPVTLLVVATLLSIWAASGAMMSLMEGFQAAYRLPGGRPFLHQRATAAILVLCTVAPLVAGSTLILFGSRAETVLDSWLGFSADVIEFKSWVVVLGRAVRYLLAFLSIVLAAAFLYGIGPNRKMNLWSVWPGSVLATVLWSAATMVFGWYVRNIANYNLLYGSIGAVIALLVWMYVLAVVALIGCEYNAVWEKLNTGRT
jgi:membrane protein